MRHRRERLHQVVENEAIVIKDADGVGHFFRRGLIEVPSSVEGGLLAWNLWAEVTRADFERAVRQWLDQGRPTTPPCIGTIACRVPGYVETIGVRVSIHEKPPGTRPRFNVIDDHPLRTEQEHGITAHRHNELVQLAFGKELPTS